MTTKWRSSYYYRLVLSYTLLALVLIGIAGGLLVPSADRIMTREVAKDARYGLLNVKDMVENNFLRIYEDSFFNKVLATVNANSSEEINYLLERPAEGNVSRIVKFITDLGLIQNMTPGLDGITVYMQKGGYAVDHYRYYASPASSDDAAFIEALPEAPAHQWFRRTKPDEPGHQVMTYVFPLPYYASPAEARGFLYLDISVAHLQSLMQNVLNYPQSRLYLFDEQGEIVVGGDADAAEIGAVRGALAATVGGGAAEPFVRYGNRIISVLPQSDSGNGWTYAIVRPLDSFLLSTESLKRQVWTACLLALLGGLIASFLMSRHFYMPLKRLLYSIRNLYTGPPPAAGRHEYAAIDHMLRFIDLNMMRMKDQVRTKQIHGLLTGQTTAAGSGELPAIPLECRYAVVYLVGAPEAGPHIARLAAELKGLTAEPVSLSATETALLVFLYGDGEEERIAGELETIRPGLEGFTLGGGIGRAVDNVEAIPGSYEEAKIAFAYTYVQGRDALIRYDDIAERREASATPNVAYEKLRNMLAAGAAADAERWMAALQEKLRNGSYALEAIELVRMRIDAMLSEIALEQKLQALLPIPGGQAAGARPTLEEAMEGLKRRAVELAVHIGDNREDAHSGTIAELQAYIAGHLADDLSLEELAGQAGLSANYISTLFGTATGESFTEYLNRIRLEHAAELLVSDRTLTVTAIASSSGFRNAQYFCTKFKARFGVTPLQYRSAAGAQVSLAD